jgi:hypothetical protein
MVDLRPGLTAKAGESQAAVARVADPVKSLRRLTLKLLLFVIQQLQMLGDLVWNWSCLIFSMTILLVWKPGIISNKTYTWWGF